MITTPSDLLCVLPDHIPAEMKQARRWLGYKLMPKQRNDGTTEYTKEPRQARQPFRKGSSTNADTWCNFETAMAAYRAGSIDGLGFALGDGWAGVDIDNGITETGYSAEAYELLHDLSTYAEVSPSGRGIHLIAYGNVAEGRRNGNVEVYGAGRYFTVTGQPLPLTLWLPETVEDCQEQLDALVERIDAVRACRRPPSCTETTQLQWPAEPPAPPAPAAEIIQRGHEVCRGFTALWAGCTEAYDADMSRADMALIGHLAWLCGPGQQALVHSIAMQSGLRREKWEEREDYLRRTIDAAYRGRGADDFHRWHHHCTAPRVDIVPLPSSSEAGGVLDLTSPATLDDIGFARRLAAEVAGHVRYVSDWKKCIWWDGSRWALDRDDACLIRAAQDLRDRLWHEFAGLSAEKRTRQATAFIHACGQARRLQAVVSLAKSQHAIRMLHRELDKHPYLLNLRNGTIDLRTGTLRPHDPQDFITQVAAVDFDAEATSEEWLTYVNQCMQGDQELVQFLRASAGLMLSGDVSPQLLWCHHGNGRNGKSTFLGALSQMLGDYAIAAPSNFLMMRKSDAHPTEIAMFYGKRLVTAIECEGGQRLRESFVKLMTGGDLVAARRMKEDFWQMAPTWHIHVSFNEPPTITGTDDGIRRRLKMVPWHAKFEGANRDEHLKARLESEQHRAAILNWCLAGMGDYLSHGMPEAAAVSEETDAYIREQDLLGNFITDCCTGDGGRVECTEFVKAFHYWLDRRGENTSVWKATRIGRELKRRGFEKYRESAGAARGKTFYMGLTLHELAPREH